MKESARYAILRWEAVLKVTRSYDERALINEIIWGLRQYVHDQKLKEAILNKKEVFVTGVFSKRNGKVNL